MVWECQQVTPSTIFWNYTLDGVCYQYVPVKVGKETLFILPGTKDLTNQAPEVPCEHHLTGIHVTSEIKPDGSQVWVTSNGPIHVTELPVEVIWKKLWRPFTFKAPALYHNYLAGIPSSVGMLQSLVFHLSKLEAVSTHLVNYTSEFSTDPRAIREALVGAGTAVGRVVEGKGGRERCKDAIKIHCN